MAGERAERIMALAARAAARTARRMAMIADYYAAFPATEELTLTLEEMYREWDEVGHGVPDPDCQRPACVKGRALIQQAMMAVQQQMAVGNGQ